MLLIRHGESMAVVPGSPESADPPLSERGVEQAAALAARLARSLVRRGLLVGHGPRRRHGRGPGRARVASRCSAAPTSARCSSASGRTAGSGAALLTATLTTWPSPRLDVGSSIPGAETDDELRARIVAALARSPPLHPSGSVAVVCHGGLINAWLAQQTGSYRSMVASIDNTSVTQLRTDGERWLLLGVNDRHHLGDPLSPVAAAPSPGG